MLPPARRLRPHARPANPGPASPPQCFFAALAWGQCLYYDQGKSKALSLGITVTTIVLVGAFEACFVLTGRLSSKAVTAYGTLSAIFIVVGLLPQFYEVYKFRAVVGVSLVFLAVDFGGAVFSTLSLVFADGSFDTLAAVNYAAVGVLELLIFALVPILNPPHWRRLAAQQRRDEEAMTQSDGGEPGAVGAEKAGGLDGPEGGKAAAEEQRGRSSSVGSRPVSERGPMGWADEAVAETMAEAEEGGRRQEPVGGCSERP